MHATNDRGTRRSMHTSKGMLTPSSLSRNVSANTELEACNKEHREEATLFTCDLIRVGIWAPGQ